MYPSLKFIFSIFSCLFCLILFSQNSEFKYQTYQDDGNIMPYRILLPKKYDENKKYPLLVFLHGAGERGSDNNLQLTHGSNQFLSETFRQNYPSIIIFPQCPKNGYWASATPINDPLKFSYPKKPIDNPILDLVEGILKKIRKEYSIDKKRIYVGGLSMGGMGTYEIVYRNPRLFAAAFAICGGANSKIARKIRKPSWRIDHGDEDTVVPIKLSEFMVTSLENQKANVKFNTYKGVSHNSWDNVFADVSFLPWLFSQKK
jgi:predicted peptidase